MGSLNPNGAEHLHLLIEAKKLAFSDRDHFITDPDFEKIPVEELISKEYAKKRRKKIDLKKAMPSPLLSSPAASGDTVYVTAVDKEKNAISFISSIYLAFGSGMVVDGTGVALQNRGKSFSLDLHHFNRLEPHKRPMHTIIPGMLFKEDEFLMSFGVMGGDMQPQGHVQFLLNLIDFKMNLQEAIDTPRVRHLQGLEVYLEDGIPKDVARALHDKGHQIIQGNPTTNQVGGGQAIYLDQTENVFLGASDRRKDGCALGY
jgi:gamma-glutamyltranspeptidase/glutathione hydrolase